MSSFEIAVGRERVITALGIVAVVAFSWAYVWTGAGIGMSALEMTAVALFPHRLADGGGGMDLSLPTVILMWWVMMIAMMTPSATPLILLYRRVLRHHASTESSSAVPSMFLLAGYLTAWLAFSICAASLQEAAATDRPHFGNDAVVEERSAFRDCSGLGGPLPVLAAQARLSRAVSITSQFPHCALAPWRCR